MTTSTSTPTGTVGPLHATRILAGTELRLMTREWAAMVFAFAFPVLLMLILAGVFGTKPSAEYGGATPDDYYVADYLAVPLGALALIGLPVMIAGYRERGVLRRFASAGVPEGVVLGAQALVTVVLMTLGAAAVLAVAAPVYGVPQIHRPAMVLLGMALGTVVMLGVGIVLGLIAKTTRSAQALGLLAFFPMWLLGAGGPPRSVMPEPMQAVSDLLPLGRVSAAVRESWLGAGSISNDLAALLVWLLVVVALMLLARRRLR